MESNPREREMLEITEASIRITPAYGNGHCIYAALAQMSFELMAHAINLKASAEDLPSQPKTLNQTHAKVYRDSLITIDESALIIALWTISRGRAHGRSSSWEDTKALIAEHDARIPAGLLPDEILSRIRVRILERPSIITQNGELFRLVEMFNLLPAEMQGPAQACFNRIVQTTGPEVPTMPSDPTNLFATLICLFVATYNSPEARLRLPPRVTRWLAFLIENYPLASDDTENVHPDLEHSRDTLRLFQEYVTAAQPGQLASVDGVDWLASNSGWLEADWIRWSWTVASSEMVMLPLEPLQILKMDGPLRLNKQPVLYIPQE
jgi:hypothetical protein